MIPEIRIMVNPLLMAFIRYDNDNCLDCESDGISLTRLNYMYNDGLKGYFTSLIASSADIDELSGKVDEFKRKFIESVKIAISYAEGRNGDAGRLETIRAQCQERWRRFGDAILRSISEAYCSDWKDRTIDVYFIPDEAEHIAKSNPLIIPVKNDADVDTVLQILTHELLHRHAATTGQDSLYALISMKAKENNISKHESYGRIIHPLLFYSAWHFVNEICRNDCEPFYIREEFSNSKFFRNTILMLEKYWGRYRNGELSKEDFVFLFFKDYMNNADRAERKRMINA